MKVEWTALIPLMVHEARAQVRRGTTHAQLLERTAGNLLDGEAMSHLKAVLESQTDLNRLLVRFTQFAEAVSTAPAEDDTIALGVVVLGAKLECRDMLQKAGGELVAEQLPATPVHPKLQTVLSELIDNAIRFRAEAAPPRITIRAEEEAGGLRILVEDNGIGVPQSHRHKLFQAFTRLEARSGFGLGLAICQAIMDKVGGEIGEEPKQGGARFIVRVPHKG